MRNMFPFYDIIMKKLAHNRFLVFLIPHQFWVNDINFIPIQTYLILSYSSAYGLVVYPFEMNSLSYDCIETVYI